MHLIAYVAALPFLYLLSILPMPVLYAMSDGLRFLLFRIAGYRRNVVQDNLIKAFPDKTPGERNRIEWQFYRQFCDLIVETVKLLTIRRSTLCRMVTIPDAGVLQGYYDAGQHVVALMGHLGNWELGGARMGLAPLHQLHVVYHPLHNPYFERLIYRMRTSFGNRMYRMREASQIMSSMQDTPGVIVLIADQAPASKNLVWLPFLNRETAFFSGPGRMAHAHGLPVVYASVHRVRRGRYEVRFAHLCENGSHYSPEEIMRMYAAQLEKDIRLTPADWLWTHRRWKHTK
ncbi:MAG: lysophospholipid acyltransferase family protein [Saprospiraceae bacterium]|nr:lysophospholipid acyltransferase family protein [Saprospiraceae bacterium]